MSKQRLIEITEYLFLGLTIAGSIAATMTQQLVYIAVPLTLSIALNVINRPRFNSSHLQAKIEQLQANIDNFTDRFDQIQTTTEKYDRQLPTNEPVTENMNEVNVSQIEKRLENLTTAFNQYSQQFPEIDNRLTEVEIAIEIITQTVKKQGEELNKLEALENLENLEFNFSEIHEEIKDEITRIDSRFLGLEEIIQNLMQTRKNQITELKPPYQSNDPSLEEYIGTSNMPTEFGEFSNLLETNDSTSIEDTFQDTVSLEFEKIIPFLEAEQENYHIDTEEESYITENNEHEKILTNREFEQTIPMLEFDQLIPVISIADDEDKLSSVGNLKGHKGKVLSVVFSPNGQLLASGSDDKSIKIWDLLTQQHRTLAGHEDATWHGGVNAVAFSIDGKILASGSDDKTIRLWDVETGNQIISLTGHEDKIHSLAFSPLGKILASGSKDKTVKIWSIDKRKEVYSLQAHQDDVLCVVFSPDGKLLATCGDGKDGTIKIIKLAESKIRTINVNSDWFSGGVNALAFSPNGKILASGDYNKTIKLWDVETSLEIKTLSGHSDQVFSLAFSPDGKILASASQDKTVKLWDIKQGVEISSMQLGEDAVYTVAFSPDGKILAAGSGDKNITLFPCK